MDLAHRRQDIGNIPVCYYSTFWSALLSSLISYSHWGLMGLWSVEDQSINQQVQMNADKGHIVTCVYLNMPTPTPTERSPQVRPKPPKHRQVKNGWLHDTSGTPSFATWPESTIRLEIHSSAEKHSQWKSISFSCSFLAYPHHLQPLKNKGLLPKSFSAGFIAAHFKNDCLKRMKS